MANRLIYDLIIVGGGPGGLSAAIYSLRASMRTVLIEQTAPGGQVLQSDAVENYPGFKNISGYELSQRLLEHAQDYNLELLTEQVIAIEPGLDLHTIRLASGECLKTHAVILATGGSPRQLGIPGERELYGKGVSYCAVCDGFFFRNKTVVVVGGGDTAAEEALYLSKLTKKVYLVHRRDRLRASMILQQRLQNNANIEFLWNRTVTDIVAGDNGVEEVTIQEQPSGTTHTLKTDGVFIFIGFDPNNELVPAGVKCNADGYVITDEKCETQIPGIFVIGDLREKFARQIVLSAADGCLAALAASHYVETRRAQQD